MPPLRIYHNLIRYKREAELPYYEVKGVSVINDFYFDKYDYVWDYYCLIIDEGEQTDIIDVYKYENSGKVFYGHPINNNYTYFEFSGNVYDVEYDSQQDKYYWIDNDNNVVYLNSYYVTIPDKVLDGSFTNIQDLEYYLTNGQVSPKYVSFDVTFVDLQTQETSNETISVQLDSNKQWSFQYPKTKKITALSHQDNVSYGCDGIEIIEALISIDFSNADNFSEFLSGNYMFNDYYSQIETINFSSQLFNNMTSAVDMFQHNHNLTTLNLSNATFENLVDAEEMFMECSGLTTLNLSNATFENLVNAEEMFRDCENLITLNLNNAAFESLTDAELMFFRCYDLVTIISNVFTFENVTNTREMFSDCYKLTTLNLSNATFEDLTNSVLMFYACGSLVTLNLSSAVFDNLTDAGAMFCGCINLTTLVLSNNTFENLVDAGEMFLECRSLTTLNLSNATFEKMTDGMRMFKNCNSLSSLDLSSATFEKLIYSKGMFYNCNHLVTLDLRTATFERLITSMDNEIDNVNNRYLYLGMFENCSALTTLYLNSATFERLKDERIPYQVQYFPSNSEDPTLQMFRGCTSLVNLYVPNSATYPINLYIGDSPLSSDSIERVSYWLKDLTSGTQQTLYLKQSAWNMVQNQSTIETRIRGKNWDLQLV